MPYYQPHHLDKKLTIKNFVLKEVMPHAKEFDESQTIPRTFFKILAGNGYLGACIPHQYGGHEMDYITLGIMHEEFAQALVSLENVLTVYGMVCKPIVKFGSEEQRLNWLPKIATGETIVALAITEPNIGSDIKNVETHAILQDDFYILNGTKKFITLGQIADLFLVLVNCNEQMSTFLVERSSPGIEINPITNLLGLRANMLAEINFNNCKVPKHNLLGKIGNGLTHIISCALDEGRYTTAHGCVGLGQACLDAAQDFIDVRIQGGTLLKNHQLIQKMVAEIIVNVKAARELCYNAGNLRLIRDVSYISETLVAKYFASQMAVFVANHTLQIFGASGFTKEHAVERFYRDAKIMEVIEGTSQIHEINIAKICLN